MLQKLQWDYLQHAEHEAQSKCYRIRNDLVAIPASAHLQPAAVLTRGSETRGRSSAEPTHTVILLSKRSLPVEHTSC